MKALPVKKVGGKKENTDLFGLIMGTTGYDRERCLHGIQSRLTSAVIQVKEKEVAI